MGSKRRSIPLLGALNVDDERGPAQDAVSDLQRQEFVDAETGVPQDHSDEPVTPGGQGSRKASYSP